jgi:hypothetical protein
MLASSEKTSHKLDNRWEDPSSTAGSPSILNIRFLAMPARKLFSSTTSQGGEELTRLFFALNDARESDGEQILVEILELEAFEKDCFFAAVGGGGGHEDQNRTRQRRAWRDGSVD